MPRRTILVILGLDLGADDYVVKLFSLQEIVSRVRAEQPPDAAPPPTRGIILWAYRLVKAPSSRPTPRPRPR